MFIQPAEILNPLSPVFALIVFLLAFFSAHLLNRIFRPVLPAPHSRFETIDGLRGLLGLSVFVHHASIWHQYLQTGIWTLTPSNLFNHFGQTGVAFFFMISAFLFTTRLLQTRNEPFSWRHFFISRFFRLVPMYLFALALIILFVLILSKWQLQVSFPAFLVSVLRLAAFEIPGETVLNNHPLANLINAKITWTLRFEWLFYFSLPLLALFILKNRPATFYLILSTVFIGIFYKYHGLHHYHDYLSFAGGILAAFLVHYLPLNFGKYKHLANIVILLCFLAIPQFKTADDVFCKTFIFLAFLLIAAGNNIFGVLQNATLKLLGEICYSTYLLHGILLFTVFHFGFGQEKAAQLTATVFSLVVFAITPILILISFFGFRFIEKPAIHLAKKIRPGNSKFAASRPDKNTIPVSGN